MREMIKDLLGRPLTIGDLMMNRKKLLAIIVFSLSLMCFHTHGKAVKAADVIYDNIEGRDGEYTYSLWKDYGNTRMTLKGNGKFECSWQDIGNALFREGIKFDCTKKHTQIGSISVEYDVDYNPNGNSYLCVYGWSRDPLIEYYIVDSWGTWRPPGAGSKGIIEVDGGTYDIYETTRVNQPSIDGNTTFKQYWSVRTSKRTGGTISVTEHFKAWEELGIQLGNLYETSLTIEGYQSSGNAEVYTNVVRIGGSSDEGNTEAGIIGDITGTGSRYECESMTKSGRYAGNIFSPFAGAALYANADSVSTTVDFTSDKHDFTLRGASNGTNTARVDLVIDGLTKGTFNFTGTGVTESTIKNVSTATGSHKVELVLSEDDGTWDAFLDSLLIEESIVQESIKPARPVVHATVSGEGLITITIDKTENATGYRIYVKKPGSKKYKKIKTIKKNGRKVRTYSYEPPVEGKYSFKVKAYTKIDGKTVWGKASKAVKTGSAGYKDSYVEKNATEKETLPLSYSGIDEDFTDTMYDYSFAGMKSAAKRVPKADYISVAEYGVIPDTGEDCSERIMHAIYDAASKGKYLYFPKGTYYVKNVKIWDVSNIKLCGDGEATILKTADDAVGEEKWDIAMGFYNCMHCTIRNLTFDGNNGKVAGNLSTGVLQLRIDNCEDTCVYGCRFQNNNNGNINVVGHVEGLKIFYCDFLNSDCSVVVMPGYITNGYICNNFIDGQDWVWSEPISLYNAPDDEKPNENVIISGNDIRNHTQGAGGVFITYPSKDIYVLNNYFYNCGAGIGCGSRLQLPDDSRGPWDVQCKNNVIDSPEWHGFALLYAKGWIIEDNTVRNLTDGFAMYLDRCSDCMIRNNSIDGCRIFEADCRENNIFDNR